LQPAIKAALKQQASHTAARPTGPPRRRRGAPAQGFGIAKFSCLFNSFA
jgi:hypothetical protein